MAQKLAIMRCEKLSSLAEVSKAIGHSSREREVLNADKDVPNETLVAGTFEDFKAALPEKNRKNAVYGLDVFMGTSPDFFKGRDPEKIESWKNRAMTWLKEEFGASNIIRADLHLDEKTPHIQAIVMPKLDGKLNAKHWLDGRQKLSAMQDRHHEAVKDLGLERGLKGSGAKHTEVKEFYKAIKAEVPELPPVENKKKALGVIITESAEKYLERAKPQLDALKAMAKRFILLAKENERLKWSNELLTRKLDRALHPEKYPKRELAKEKDRTRGR